MSAPQLTTLGRLRRLKRDGPALAVASWGHGVMGATMANAGQRGKFRFVWPAKMRETSKMVRARCMFARNDVGDSVTSP